MEVTLGRRYMHILFFIFFSIFSVKSFATIKVAITVDDLPTHDILPVGVTRIEVAKKMLEIFKKHKVPEAYGFINGDQLKWGHEEILTAWTDAGYPLGNHTFTHHDLNEVTLLQYQNDIQLNVPVLEKRHQQNKINYFRYPYLHEGDTEEKRNGVRKYLKSHQYKVAEVTLYWEDYSWNAPYARCRNKNDLKNIEWLQESFLKSALDELILQQTKANLLFKREISHILLYHIGAFDAEVLDALLASYKKRGVEFITLEEAMKDEVYSLDSKYVNKIGVDFLQQIAISRGETPSSVDIPREKLSQICL